LILRLDCSFLYIKLERLKFKVKIIRY
jgi:hypothetical protein